MRRQHIITIAAAALLAALAVSCSKTAPEEAALRQRFSIPADMPVKDLGEIHLLPDTPKRVSLGKGKDCTISATALTNDLLRMSLVYESGIESAGGRVDNSTQRSTFLLQRGQQCAPTIGKQLTVVMKPVLITP